MPNANIPIAYLVSRYPAVSHTFILREISQLRALGQPIYTASINPPDRALDKMDASERAEAMATYGVKADGAWSGLLALGYWAMRNPGRLASMLKLSLRFGGGVKSLAYAVEASMVARWMERKQLAHLHVHFGNAGASVGVLVKELSRCHLSYTIHGPDEFDDVPGQQLALKVEAADSIVCISQFARSQLMRISAPGHWTKLQVCRLGVDPKQFAPIEKALDVAQPTMLCVGRLTPAKGQVLLVQACARLRDLGVAFKLVFVGDGPDRERVESAISDLRLQDRVTLTGSLTQQGVREALGQADIFVLPSLAEGIPVVLMEAMSSGVPCVSTPVNGIPELIEHGQTGLLARPGDVDSLVTQLHRLCSNPTERRELAHAALHKVQSEFNLNTNVVRLHSIFAQFPRVTMTESRLIGAQ